jgi:acetyl-CoA synthetase
MKINSFEDYQKTYKKSVEKPEEFWDEVAQEFQWKKPYSKVLECNRQARRNRNHLGTQRN